MTLGMVMTFQINTNAMIHEKVIDKLNLNKFENFCFVIDTVKRRERQAKDQVKYKKQ